MKYSTQAKHICIRVHIGTKRQLLGHSARAHRTPIYMEEPRTFLPVLAQVFSVFLLSVQCGCIFWFTLFRTYIDILLSGRLPEMYKEKKRVIINSDEKNRILWFV